MPRHSPSNPPEPPLVKGKIRVAVLVSTLPTGGAERVTLSVLTGLDPERFDSEVYFLKEPGTVGDQLLERGVRGFPRLWKHRYDPFIVARLTRRIRAFRPHVFLILHCHRNAMFWGGLCATFADAGARAIAVHHTGTMASHKNFENIDRWFLPSTRAIIALSESHARYLEEVDGIDPRKITIIENGIVPENYRHTAPATIEALRHEFGLGPTDPVIIMVAGLRPEKAHESVVEAARLLAVDGVSARFLLVGDGPRRGELERMARELGVGDRITFAGERRDVADLLHLASVLVLPSHPRVETLPLSVMEAMAAGVPVVASRVGSIPDMIQDGVNGRMISPADARELASAIAGLLRDTALARSMAAEGERTVREKYTLDRMTLKYANLLEQLARSK